MSTAFTILPLAVSLVCCTPFLQLVSIYLVTLWSRMVSLGVYGVQHKEDPVLLGLKVV